MGCAQQNPFGVTSHFHGKFRASVSKGNNLGISKFYPFSASTTKSKKAPTLLLDMVEYPINLKNLTVKDFKFLADKIRSDLTFVMSNRQKPLIASLAAVELTIAIHHVFNAPLDKILWDAGEQTYAHKILTGRRSRMHTLKQKNGISGSTSRFESEYDPFGAGHGCSSISAGLGMAVARDIKGSRERVVTVINSMTTTASQVCEAMSDAGYLDSSMVVILNDSRHSLLPKLEEGSKTPINPLSSTLSKLQSSKSFRKFREAAEDMEEKGTKIKWQHLNYLFTVKLVLLRGLARLCMNWAAKVDEHARGMIVPLGATLFEELGLYYIGHVDGHNIEDLITVLQEVASLDSIGSCPGSCNNGGI
ncbi:Deoxyxylulose-5-phosphate synthase [Dillenia turbinata]|uniref:Deoxyxylulose-5-phosphate synthase n=1 Tax=Dillenia turbinata TaxID=194707 RepID=A0AAN8YWX3_9MAGN